LIQAHFEEENKITDTKLVVKACRH